MDNSTNSLTFLCKKFYRQARVVICDFIYLGSPMLLGFRLLKSCDWQLTGLIRLLTAHNRLNRILSRECYVKDLNFKNSLDINSLKTVLPYG